MKGKNELQDLYLAWMYRLVCGDDSSFHSLLEYLYSVDFYYVISRDGNRAADGIDLRYRFAYENEIDYSTAAAYLDDRPCSMLEMLVALSLRCEEQFMSDSEVGNRTGVWFFTMLGNLGLDYMDNGHFDEVKADAIVEIFLERKYSPNGRGGLFYLPTGRDDLRNVEIWYQMCWYLDSIT